MFFLQMLKNYSWAGNSFYDYALSLAIFIALLIILKIFQVIILARLYKLAKKTKTDFDDVLIEIFKKIKPPFYFLIAFYFGVKNLVVGGMTDKLITLFFLLAVIYEVVRALERLLDYGIKKYLSRTKTKGKVAEQNKTMVGTLKLIARITLWVIALTLLLGNLGVDVTSIIASLGIGGIAVALALQNILSDIFSSFSLYMDKPFQAGDFVVVGADMGTVEKIGLKTTRLRTPQGEELVISNNELTSARIQNFKRMERRRVLFDLGVVYGLPPEKLRAIPKIIEEIIKKAENADFDRCHFKSFGDSALNFEVVYYINSADYQEYMDINEQINLAIYEEFTQEKIEFAYPTQTVFVNKS